MERKGRYRLRKKGGADTEEKRKQILFSSEYLKVQFTYSFFFLFLPIIIKFPFLCVYTAISSYLFCSIYKNVP